MGINADFFDAIQQLSKITPNWETIIEPLSMEEAIAYVANIRFVNVYELSRDYGGPEEGGWWFDEGSAELSIQTTAEHAESIAELLRGEYPNRRNRYSVIAYMKPSDYSVDVEESPAEDWSDYRPWE